MAHEVAAAAVVGTDLKCNYLVNPIGVGEGVPRLSWKLRPVSGQEDARGLGQSAYQIVVASSASGVAAGRGDLWDSGKVSSTQSVFVEYRGKGLAAGERAWWGVKVWDQAGRESVMSEAAFWERGIEAWAGNWIGSHVMGSHKTEAPVPFLRKSFLLPAGKQIKSARLYATALGVYECYLNGKRVGDLVFAPFWTDYRKRVQYQAYDVTELLRAGGENVAGAILGDGWYCGFIGNLQRRQFFGDRPKFLAQLVVTFTDGSTQVVGTDGSWRTAIGPILSSDFHMGESYDARQEMPGWNDAGFVEHGRWSDVAVFAESADAMGAKIVPMTGPGVKAIKTIHPVAEPVAQNRGWNYSVFLFDMGQNMVGRVRLRVKGNAGDTVVIRFAEVLDKNGNIYTTNLRSAKQTDHYTLRGDPNGEIYESHFTFHGFRYVEVTGYPGTAGKDAIEGVVLHSDMAETGTFECSEPLVNQLQKNIQWGQRGNFVDVPTDCPQRDERLGWTGDAQVFVRTAAFNFDVSGFFAKWTQDLRDAQGVLGSYPSVVPNAEIVRLEGDIEWGADGGPAWADAGVICPWTMYLCYGDRALIEGHYASMVKFVERLRSTSEKFGMIRSHPQWNGWHGFGDWLSQDGKDGLSGSTPKDLIGTAFLAYDAGLLAAMAKALGRNEDVAKYAALRSEAVEAFRRRYVTADGLIVGHSQTAYVLALQFDLLPENLKPAAIEALVSNIKSNWNKLNTGFVGTPYLQHVLTAAGRLDVAYELLLQKNWPSWLYAVTHGATTIWERWDGWTHDKGFQDAGMNSFNHYAYGAVGEWLYQSVAGINLDPARPGYEHVIFRPRPLVGGPLTFARAGLETIRGRVECGWKLDGKSLEMEVTVPANVTATAYVPAAGVVTESGKPLRQGDGVVSVEQGDGVARVELQSGHYRFASQLA